MLRSCGVSLFQMQMPIFHKLHNLQHPRTPP
ncbi:unnamed protein product [Linum tenue]|uniref:Uncharacterized protein n=1 Tax=Linum tenue TaxID=586396 RepID=A0AAV0N474_9ROSI|nr:unnamed protein product [Linum tenue]